jgi:predicted DCC family thiol-disulfide oxidoreductase YuxK
MTAPPEPSGPPGGLLLFDGVCAFCDGAVRWLIERDPQARLRFAPLQGETAAALRRRHPELPGDVDTLVYVETRDGAERVYLRSEAVWRACAAIGALPRGLRWWARLPRPLADLGYRVFARLRYRVFGRLDACRLPEPGERERFLA